MYTQIHICIYNFIEIIIISSQRFNAAVSGPIDFMGLNNKLNRIVKDVSKRASERGIIETMRL